MKRLIVVMFLALSVLPQTREREQTDQPPRLPDGRSQTEAILKDAHEKSVEDAAELLKLSEQLKKELERNEQHVLSVNSIRTAEKIEDLAKKIKKRLQRF